MQRLRHGLRWIVLVGGLLPAALPALANAADFRVRRAETTLIDSVYWLDATIYYEPSAAMLEALDNGVTLTFLIEINVARARDYLWDEDVAALEQRYQLQYHALTDQYVVKNLNSGAQQALPALDAALAFMGGVVDVPLLDRKLLQAGYRYLVNMRVSLDVEALPVPMRAIAYFSSDWRLASDWYTWPLPF